MFVYLIGIVIGAWSDCLVVVMYQSVKCVISHPSVNSIMNTSTFFPFFLAEYEIDGGWKDGPGKSKRASGIGFTFGRDGQGSGSIRDRDERIRDVAKVRR